MEFDEDDFDDEDDDDYDLGDPLGYLAAAPPIISHAHMGAGNAAAAQGGAPLLVPAPGAPMIAPAGGPFGAPGAAPAAAPAQVHPAPAHAFAPAAGSAAAPASLPLRKKKVSGAGQRSAAQRAWAGGSHWHVPTALAVRSVRCARHRE